MYLKPLALETGGGKCMESMGTNTMFACIHGSERELSFLSKPDLNFEFSDDHQDASTLT